MSSQMLPNSRRSREEASPPNISDWSVMTSLVSQNATCVPSRFLEGRFMPGSENGRFPADRGENGRVWILRFWNPKHFPSGRQGERK